MISIKRLLTFSALLLFNFAQINAVFANDSALFPALMKYYILTEDYQEDYQYESCFSKMAIIEDETDDYLQGKLNKINYLNTIREVLDNKQKGAYTCTPRIDTLFQEWNSTLYYLYKGYTMRDNLEPWGNKFIGFLSFFPYLYSAVKNKTPLSFFEGTKKNWKVYTLEWVEPRRNSTFDKIASKRFYHYPNEWFEGYFERQERPLRPYVKHYRVYSGEKLCTSFYDTSMIYKPELDRIKIVDYYYQPETETFELFEGPSRIVDGTASIWVRCITSLSQVIDGRSDLMQVEIPFSANSWIMHHQTTDLNDIAKWIKSGTPQETPP